MRAILKDEVYICEDDVDIGEVIDRIRETFEEQTKNLHIEIEKAMITAIVKYYSIRNLA